MDRSERIQRASDLYHQLASVEAKLGDWVAASAAPSASPDSPSLRPRHDLMAARAQMTALEHQISLLRLLQSENRLRQQLLIAIPSLLSGSLATLLIQRLL